MLFRTEGRGCHIWILIKKINLSAGCHLIYREEGEGVVHPLVRGRNREWSVRKWEESGSIQKCKGMMEVGVKGMNKGLQIPTSFPWLPLPYLMTHAFSPLLPLPSFPYIFVYYRYPHFLSRFPPFQHPNPTYLTPGSGLTPGCPTPCPSR